MYGIFNDWERMRVNNAARLLALCFILIPLFAFSQEREVFRGSVPEVLLRPARGESPRYPVDIVIGQLGRGDASPSAYTFAAFVASGLMAGQMQHSALLNVSAFTRENYISAINVVSPASFRIGGGREEADGAISFLIRFLGRELGITGELYIRFVSRLIEVEGEEEGETRTVGNWVFEELILDEPRLRDIENQEAASRFDFNPYERFF